MAILEKRSLLATLLLGSLLVQPVAAQQVGYAARVVREVSLKKKNEQKWEPLQEKIGIDLGWQLRTKQDSAVVVLFQPHGFLHLGERTWAIVDQSKLNVAFGCHKPKAILLEGDLRIVDAMPPESRNIEVRCAKVEMDFESPHAKGWARGTERMPEKLVLRGPEQGEAGPSDIRLRVGPDLGTLVAVYAGEAHVQPNLGEPIYLKEGEWILVGPDGAVKVPPTPFNEDRGILDDSPLLDCCDFRIDPP